MKLMTGQERKAIAIGKTLTKALLQIESFDGDLKMILDEAAICLASKPNKGVMDVLVSLAMYYCGENTLQHFGGESNE